MILLAYFLTLIIIVLVIILIAVYVLNLNKNYYNKQSAYECGFDSFGDARGSHDNHFYFVGFLFVIFDLEIVFLIPILTGLDQLTTLEYLYFVIFVGILVLGLCIEWAIGVLQWIPKINKKNINTMMNLNIILTFMSPLDQFKEEGVLDGLFWLHNKLFYCGFLANVGATYWEIVESFLIFLVSSFISWKLIDFESASQAEDSLTVIESIQLAILASNLAGILPGLETSTSDVSVTFFYSFGSLIFIMSLGWAMHKHKFFTIAYPYGTPKAMIPFIISIEIISYIARAISLGMRLFANMFAGHALVKILLAFSMQFLGSVTAYSAILSFAVVIVITLMEIGIAFLQAYVFGALVTLYFIDMARMEH